MNSINSNSCPHNEMIGMRSVHFSRLQRLLFFLNISPLICASELRQCLMLKYICCFSKAEKKHKTRSENMRGIKDVMGGSIRF